MKIYVKQFLIYVYSFFWFSIMILSCTLILPVSQLTKRLMMSQIKSHVEYLKQTSSILLLILYSKVMKYLASLIVLIWICNGFKWWFFSVAHSFGSPCIINTVYWVTNSKIQKGVFCSPWEADSCLKTHLSFALLLRPTYLRARNSILFALLTTCTLFLCFPEITFLFVRAFSLFVYLIELLPIAGHLLHTFLKRPPPTCVWNNSEWILPYIEKAASPPTTLHRPVCASQYI